MTYHRGMKRAIALVAILFYAGWSLSASAQVYRCTAKDGSVAFQDRPCAPGQQQGVVDVPSHAPPGYLPPAAATRVAPPVSNASALPPPIDAPTPAALPVMYACVGAVNGKRYLTRSPPPPYLAPLGVLGYPPQSLSRAYGAPGGAGLSAPELTRPRIGGPRIATGMTEVQDYCLPATPAEVCGFVQREQDQNAKALHAALLPSERKPLQQRAQALQDQLRNCR